MASDGALLSLIIDDDQALLVLAAWGGLALELVQIDDDPTIAALSAAAGLSKDVVTRKLAKLKVANVLLDGGISEMADRMLQTRVQSRLGKAKK
jgi:predicted negative regulator of RcsB-dependent stress response